MSVIIQIDAALYLQNTSLQNLCLGHSTVDNCVESTISRSVSRMTDNLLGFAEFPSQNSFVLPSLSYVKRCFGWNVVQKKCSSPLTLTVQCFFCSLDGEIWSQVHDNAFAFLLLTCLCFPCDPCFNTHLWHDFFVMCKFTFCWHEKRKGKPNSALWSCPWSCKPLLIGGIWTVWM